MNPLISELKTRARLLLTLLQKQHPATRKRALILSRQHGWDLPEVWQLHHCLNLAAADCGFQHWEHARHVFGGHARTGEDVGDFWYGEDVGGFFNHWYAHYAQARAHLEQDAQLFLLPYRRQFIVVTADYMRSRGIDGDAQMWASLPHDLVQAYGSEPWMRLAQQRLQMSRIERFEKTWDASRTELELQSSVEESERVLRSFVQAGRLIKIPEQKKKRLVILHWLRAQLQPEKRYPEAELNQFFLRFHEDCATLRREMIMHALMAREDGIYWCLPV